MLFGWTVTPGARGGEGVVRMQWHGPIVSPAAVQCFRPPLPFRRSPALPRLHPKPSPPPSMRQPAALIPTRGRRSGASETHRMSKADTLFPNVAAFHRRRRRDPSAASQRIFCGDFKIPPFCTALCAGPRHSRAHRAWPQPGNAPPRPLGSPPRKAPLATLWGATRLPPALVNWPPPRR